MTAVDELTPIYAGRTDAFSGKHSDELILELADREQIRELIATYAHRVTHGHSCADLFVDDGVYIRRRPPHDPHEVRGRDALDAHYVARPGRSGYATPLIHNHLIEVTGCEARAICSVELRIWDEAEPIFASGYYGDELRKEDGRWMFAKRVLNWFRWDPV